MKFPRYPDYTTTEVPWLGDIPSHWHIDRLKWSADTVVNGVWGGEPTGDEDTACIRVADFDRVALRVVLDNLTYRSVEEKDKGRRLLSPGDLLLEKSGGGEQQLVGAVVEFNHGFPAVCSNFVAKVVHADGMNGRYWTYVHAHLYSGRVNYPSIKQTTGIQNLDSSAYFNELVAYPPYEEQWHVAAFLDRETARIDALVEKKRCLLQMLEEKRLALITQAVTKGLDADVPMKDSGIKWLGEVPGHWETKRVKFLAAVGNGSTPKRDNAEYWVDGEFPWLNSSVVNHDQVEEPTELVTKKALEECHLPVITPPALLVGITGEGRTRGMVTTLVIEATINQHLAFIKPHPDEVSVEYLRLVFERAYRYLRNESSGGGSTKGAITCEQLRELVVPVPSADEQSSIVKSVHDSLGKLERAKKVIGLAIERLTEYRSTLITNAVTGQIDVRNLNKGASVA